MARKYLLARKNMPEFCVSEEGGAFVPMNAPDEASGEPAIGRFLTEIAYCDNGALLVTNEGLVRLAAPDFRVEWLAGGPAWENMLTSTVTVLSRVCVSGDGSVLLILDGGAGECQAVSFDGGKSFAPLEIHLPTQHKYNGFLYTDSTNLAISLLLREKTGEFSCLYAPRARTFGPGGHDLAQTFLLWQYRAEGDRYVNEYEGGIPDQGGTSGVEGIGRSFLVYPNYLSWYISNTFGIGATHPFLYPITFPYFLAADTAGRPPTDPAFSWEKGSPPRAPLQLIDMVTKKPSRVLPLERHVTLYANLADIERRDEETGETAFLLFDDSGVMSSGTNFSPNLAEYYCDGHFGSFIAVDLRLWQTADWRPKPAANGDKVLILSKFGDTRLKEVPLLNFGAPLPFASVSLPPVVNQRDGSIGSLPQRFLDVYHEGKSRHWLMNLFGEDESWWTARVACHET
ncbi:MAG: hypothetical protein LBU11_08360 [Zoogloeaceae bacterium]|jgi:hypothetical protein|nr:hypothetical protein [Zoogloeaceae bacterium]